MKKSVTKAEVLNLSWSTESQVEDDDGFGRDTICSDYRDDGFPHYFNELPDPRQPGKVVYPLKEVLLLSLLAVLAGAETFCDIARFGEKKLALLRRFRPFANGTPSHDRLGDIFATLDARPSRVASSPGSPR